MQSPDVAPQPSDLDVLSPAPRFYTIAGRRVEIPEASFRMCARVRALGLGLMSYLAVMPEVAPDMITIAVLAELFEQHPSDAVDLLHAGTAGDREWLTSLSALEKCELATAWIEVNGDFFARWLRMHNRMDRAVRGLSDGDGSTPSNGSRALVTPTQRATPPGKSAAASTPSSAPTSAGASIS